MTIPSNGVSEFSPDPPATAPATLPGPRPMYWSVRRELWENRSVYLAPLMGIGFILFGFLISTIRLPQRLRGLSALSPSRQHDLVAMPYSVAAGITVVMAFIVGFFYCLDALHGERRDRSILFWKSLPVSDRTTVLAKAGIPLVVLPLLSLAIILTAQLIMLLVSTTVLVGNGMNPAVLWTRLPLFQMTLALIYSLIAIALWHAPIYAWLLLVSGWAKRATFLWAVMPLLVMAAFERGAFGTSVVGKFLKHRLIGWFTQSFAFNTRGGDPGEPLSLITPGKFLSTPGLWIGLAFAAAFLAAAVRMRRNREPI
jgi:ABC-2 type transport system permease protein